jgi:hypothetical protein
MYTNVHTRTRTRTHTHTHTHTHTRTHARTHTHLQVQGVHHLLIMPPLKHIARHVSGRQHRRRWHLRRRGKLSSCRRRRRRRRCSRAAAAGAGAAAADAASRLWPASGCCCGVWCTPGSICVRLREGGGGQDTAVRTHVSACVCAHVGAMHVPHQPRPTHPSSSSAPAEACQRWSAGRPSPRAPARLHG